MSSIPDPQSLWLTGTGPCRTIKVKYFHKPPFSCFILNALDTSSSLEKVSVRQLTSYQNNQNNECELRPSSEKGSKPTSPCLESAVKFCLFLFLIVLLVYHVSNLFKTEMFELDTCDTDNQSNNLFIC